LWILAWAYLPLSTQRDFMGYPVSSFILKWGVLIQATMYTGKQASWRQVGNNLRIEMGHPVWDDHDEISVLTIRNTQQGTF